MTSAITRATTAIVRVSMARPYSVSPAVSPDLRAGHRSRCQTDGGVQKGSSQALAPDEHQKSLGR